MAVMMKHAPGTFCWAELATNDPKQATAFYTALFGWTAVDSPMPDGMVYTMLEMEGAQVAALYAMDPSKMPPGMPPNWMAYLAVDDADATAAKVKANGGSVMAEPFDVMDFGRMAVCADNVGATFAIWQSGTHTGIGRAHEPGALSWVQLNATDPGDAAMFYQAVFGWTHRRDPMPGDRDYITFQMGSQPTGGGMPMPPGMNAPAHWLLYFGSDDVDATASRAAKLGAKTMVPPTDIPGTGRFAVFMDPQGAAFAVVNFGK